MKPLIRTTVCFLCLHVGGPQSVPSTARASRGVVGDAWNEEQHGIGDAFCLTPGLYG